MRWEDSYIGKLKATLGNQKLIVPSVRAIIENKDGQILFIKRVDEGKWGLPAGSIELEESIYECLVREVREETGLQVISARTVAIYSNPKYGTRNKFGDEYQLFELLFWVNEWTGSLIQKTKETTSAEFHYMEDLPLGTNDFWNN